MKTLLASLIRPSESVPDDDRKQATYLMVMLLGFIALCLIVLIIFPLSYRHDRTFQRAFTDPVFYEVMLIGPIGCTLAYWLIRNGKLRAGKYVMVLVFALFPIISTLMPLLQPATAEDMSVATYERMALFLILPIMLASSFLSLREAFGVLVAVIVYIVVLQQLTPAFPQGSMIKSLVTLTSFSIIQIVLTWQKDQVERDRRQRLETLNEQLRIREREAQHANQLKTEFLAVTSHELKTPLNSILGFTDCLLNKIGVTGPELSDDQKTLLERVKVKSKDLLTNINDILDMSRLEAQKVEVTLEEYSPIDLVYQHMKDIAPMAAEKGLSLRSTIAPDAPTSVIGDPHLFSRILTNLLANALKFTEAGTIEVDMRLADADHWQLRVSDTGVGIPPDQQQSIFQPFRQVDSSSTRLYGGSGLGLAIARSNARLMSGDVSVTSEVGKGSTFTVTLPVTLSVPDVLAASTVSLAA